MSHSILHSVIDVEPWTRIVVTTVHNVFIPLNRVLRVVPGINYLLQPKEKDQNSSFTPKECFYSYHTMELYKLNTSFYLALILYNKCLQCNVSP